MPAALVLSITAGNLNRPAPNRRTPMTTLRKIKHRLAAEFSELYEAFYAAQEWIEEGDIFGAARSGLDSLNEKTRVGLGNCDSHVALKH
jgi:hypothetical protein